MAEQAQQQTKADLGPCPRSWNGVKCDGRLLADDEDGGFYTVERCSRCNATWTSHIPHPVPAQPPPVPVVDDAKLPFRSPFLAMLALAFELEQKTLEEYVRRRENKEAELDVGNTMLALGKFCGGMMRWRESFPELAADFEKMQAGRITFAASTLAAKCADCGAALPAYRHESTTVCGTCDEKRRTRAELDRFFAAGKISAKEFHGPVWVEGAAGEEDRFFSSPAELLASAHDKVPQYAWAAEVVLPQLEFTDIRTMLDDEYGRDDHDGQAVVDGLDALEAFCQAWNGIQTQPMWRQQKKLAVIFDRPARPTAEELGDRLKVAVDKMAAIRDEAVKGPVPIDEAKGAPFDEELGGEGGHE